MRERHLARRGVVRGDDDTTEVVRVSDDVREGRHAGEDGEGLEGREAVVRLRGLDSVLGRRGYLRKQSLSSINTNRRTSFSRDSFPRTRVWNRECQNVNLDKQDNCDPKRETRKNDVLDSRLSNRKDRRIGAANNAPTKTPFFYPSDKEVK